MSSLAPSPAATALAAVKALRPRQWPKNAFLFAALLFSFQFDQPDAYEVI